jgi:hypothetical protein
MFADDINELVNSLDLHGPLPLATNHENAVTELYKIMNLISGMFNKDVNTRLYSNGCLAGTPRSSMPQEPIKAHTSHPP